MTARTGLGIGMAALAAAGLATAPPTRAAGQEKSKDVEVFRFAGSGARLGVTLEDVGADDVARLHLSDERGAVIKDVAKDSAAEKAGLKEGDVVLSYQGEKVWSAAQLRRMVRETPPGRHVALEVSRAGAVQRLSATLEEAKDQAMALGDDAFHFDFDVPVPPIPPVPPLAPLLEEREHGGRRFLFRDRMFDMRPGRLGLSYQELSGQLARYFKVEEGALLVTDVEADGPAAKAGLRAGDVIVKLDGKPIKDGEDLRRGIGDAPAGTDVTLGIQREGRAMDLKVTPRGATRGRRPGETT